MFKIAFGMNIDCISNKNEIFNTYISEILNGVNKVFEDPFFRINPYNWKKLKDLKKMIRYLRQVGRDKILERINVYKEQESAEANDILSSILKSYSQL